MSKRIGQMLQRLRTEKKLTQIQLAKRAKVSQSYVTQLERGGKANPNLAVLTRIAKALKVNVKDLLP